ncbi:ArnT family glycosyltransferase [Jatrophihabitans sp. YIM 134969]
MTARAQQVDGDAVPPFARAPVLGAALAVVVVLTAASVGYGYDRDELYFRMLRPAWGYVDQPFLTPLIVHGVAQVVDTVWAIRFPGTLFVAASVVVVGLLAREFGGDRGAQALAAWGYGFAAMPLALGHTAITATFDLPFWPAIALAVARAQLRNRPRWWLVAGALVGIDLWNKVLVVVLLAALLAGIVVAGPRDLLRSRWVWGGVAVAVVVGSPTIVYQLVNGLPQLDVGAAVADHNASDVRVQMWWFLFLILGPPLTIVWVAGLAALWGRPAVRFLAAAFPFLLLGVFAMGSQVYYPLGLVTVLYAAGCAPVVRWWRRGRAGARRGLAVGLVALNVVVSSVLGLPVVPVGAVGSTPVPGINMLVADSIGWPRYVDEIRAVYDATSAPSGAEVVVLASNYGEAGAVSRYAPELPVVSGQNALWDQTRPAADATVVVVVGDQYDQAQRWFASCEVRARLDNGVDVDNEEQDVPVAVCRDPVGGWDTVWPRVRHLD